MIKHCDPDVTKEDFRDNIIELPNKNTVNTIVLCQWRLLQYLL